MCLTAILGNVVDSFPNSLLTSQFSFMIKRLDAQRKAKSVIVTEDSYLLFDHNPKNPERRICSVPPMHRGI